MPNITKQLEEQHGGSSVYYQGRFYFRDGMVCEEGIESKLPPTDPAEVARNQLVYWNCLLDEKVEQFRKYKFQISGTRKNWYGPGQHFTPSPRPEQIEELKQRAKLVEYIRSKIDECELILNPPVWEPSEQELSRAVFLARERSRLSQHIDQLHREFKEMQSEKRSKAALRVCEQFAEEAQEQYDEVNNEWKSLDERLRQRANNALCDERNAKMIEAAEAIEI